MFILKREGLTPLHSFKKFPILSSCVDDAYENDKFADMNWGCDENGNVLLIDLLDTKLIYDNYHTGGIIGNTWKKHQETFFNIINEHQYENVLEIGGSGGMFAKRFLNIGKNFNWSLIEPNSLPKIENDKLTFIKGYFESYDFDKKYDTIVHSHCFEHIYDPLSFLNKTNKLLLDGGQQFISIPNMHFWLKSGFTNTLTFEHTFYCDLNVLNYMLSITGFRIEQSLIEEHSIFVRAKKVEKSDKIIPNFNYVEEMFQYYVQKLTLDTNNIRDTIGDRKYYIFGGHIFAQYLINLGLPENQCIAILDNDPNKQGKRLYGTKLMVHSPSIIKNTDALVVLRAGVYNEEIRNNLLEINPSTIII